MLNFGMMHDESAGAENVEEPLNVQFRRRFAELITQPPNAIAQVVITGPDAKTPMEYKRVICPKADIPTAQTNARFRGQSRH
jgi:hypothetical protein